ncbi:hypothetical protein V8G54_025320 [Vigna mungo]|uniref:Uncharacterized protein n=1 Tax=Vigna mungo TaxID=3915 RepID=A0AAQ3N7H5_VIGMU
MSIKTFHEQSPMHQTFRRNHLHNHPDQYQGIKLPDHSLNNQFDIYPVLALQDSVVTISAQNLDVGMEAQYNGSLAWAALLLIGAIFAYFPGIEADTPNTVAYSSVFVSVVSLIIGNIGRRRSRPGLLRFYAIVSSIAMLLLIASLAKKHLLLKDNVKRPPVSAECFADAEHLTSPSFSYPNTEWGTTCRRHFDAQGFQVIPDRLKTSWTVTNTSTPTLVGTERLRGFLLQVDRSPPQASATFDIASSLSSYFDRHRILPKFSRVTTIHPKACVPYRSSDFYTRIKKNAKVRAKEASLTEREIEECSGALQKRSLPSGGSRSSFRTFPRLKMLGCLDLRVSLGSFPKIKVRVHEERSSSFSLDLRSSLGACSKIKVRVHEERSSPFGRH